MDRVVGYNNYLDTHNNNTVKQYHIVSAYTMLYSPNIQSTLIRVNKEILMDDENQQDFLLQPYQAIAYGIKFNITLSRYRDRNDMHNNLYQ